MSSSPAYTPGQTVYSRFGGPALTVVDCNGCVATVRDPNGKTTGVIVGDITAKTRRVMPFGECTYCDAHRHDSMMPSHTASPRCESGRRPHCTCDTCF